MEASGAAQSTGNVLAKPASGQVIQNLQVLRAVAATLVVLYHVQRSAGKIAGQPYENDFGAFGVDIFFVISGFIMFYTTAGFRRSPREFVTDRVIRVVPLYWIATLALYAIYLVGFSPNGVHYATPLDVVTSLAFIPRELPNGTSPVLLSLGWTLIYEMQFYLFFAATFFMRSHWRSLITLSMVFAVLSLAPLLVKLPFMVAYFTNTIMFEFILGALLALLVRYFPTQPTWPALLFALALAAVGVIAIAGVPIHHLEKGLSWDCRALRAGVPAAVIVASALAFERLGFVCRAAPLLLLGSASYALYLFHPLVLQPAMRIFAWVVQAQGLWVAIAANLFALALTFAAAIAAHMMLERPITRRLKRRRTSAAPPPVPSTEVEPDPLPSDIPASAAAELR